MVKWIETTLGTLIKWEDVILIGYDCTDDSDVYFSYLQTKNGCRFDFLDLPEEVFYKDKKYEVDADIVISFHKSIVLFIE